MKKYIMTLDQGTTSSRAIIFDKEGNLIDIAQKSSSKFIQKLDMLNMILWKYGELNQGWQGKSLKRQG